MADSQEKQHCLNNLVLMLLADGEVSPRELDFLNKVAKILGIEVADWPLLVRSVQASETPVFPIENREFSLKVLKSMVEMARRDGCIDDAEKRLLLLYVKASGLVQADLKEILPFDSEGEPDGSGSGEDRILVVTTEFEKIDDFKKTLAACGVGVKLAEYKDVLHGDALEGLTIVCLHGAVKKETTVKRCRNLMEKNQDLTIVPILGRYQGNQVKYLHEIGLKRCVVEAVFPEDVANILADARGKKTVERA